MIKAVVFGMDGVLIDTEKWHYECWRKAVQEAGFEISREQLTALCGASDAYVMQYLAGKFGPVFPCEKVRDRKREWMREHVSECGIKRKTGAKDVLDYLRANKIRTAAAASGDRESAEEYLRQAELLEKLDIVVCETIVKNKQTDSDIYHYACEQMGIETTDCIVAEAFPDRAHAAAAAGFDTIMVPGLVKPGKEEEKRVGAQIDTLYDIILMLEDGII